MIDNTTIQSDPAKPTSSQLSLKVRVLKAGGWSVLAHLLSNVLRLGSSLVMTRLLVPEMFGVMAIATVVTVIVSLLTDVGLRQSIIQSPRGNLPTFLNTAWTLQVLRGGFIWVGCVCVAAGIFLADQMAWFPQASVYADVSLPWVIAAASFSAVFSGFQSTKAITANRDLDLKRVTLIELLTQLAGIVVMFVLAWWTRSIWSFVAGGLFSSALSAVLCHTWLVGERNHFAWDRKALKEIVGYGRWVFLSSTFGVVASNADRLLIGMWASAAVLGYYAIALNIATVVEGLGLRLFGSVAMPALSQAARDNPCQFRKIYFRMRLPADLAFISMAGFLFSAAPFIIELLYDPRYAPSGELLRLLSFGLLFARYGMAQSAYLSLGQPRYVMMLNAAKLVSVFILVPALYSLYGIPGAVAGVAIHVAPTVPLIWWFNHKHALNDFRFEMLVLLAWPVGYIAGTVLGLR